MKRIHKFILIVLTCFAFVPSHLFGVIPQKTYVQVEVIPEHSKVQTNGENWIALKFNMEPDWHIYAEDPGEMGLPTTFDFTLPEGVSVEEILWPKDKTFITSGLTTYGFDQEAIFLVRLKGTFSNEDAFSVDVKWLACHQVCVPGGKKIDWTWATSNMSESEREALFQRGRANLKTADDLATTLPEQSVSKTSTTSTKAEAPMGYLWVLGFAFLGGLLLNVMPCVLPVLSIKIIHILEHREGQASRRYLGAMSYTLGVLVSFWTLALFLISFREAGEQLGWGFQLQDIRVVCALMVVFLCLSLNLFGVFEMGLSLVGADQKASSSQGLTSAFLSGALATVAATPCTAPFMASALSYALSLETFESLLIFTALGLGMALPFLAVAVFPKALAFLPKPGAWMVQLKQGLGFLLMGTVAYLMHVAAALAEAPEHLMNIGLGLVIISFALWIYGQWGYGQSAKVWMTRALCIGLVALGIWNFGYDKPSLSWEVFDEGELQQAQANNEPIFLDFTASWCTTCTVNKKLVFNTDATAKLFAEYGVRAMRADWTKMDPAITNFLESVGRSSVPVYIYYAPNSDGSPMFLPEILSLSDLETAFQRGDSKPKSSP
jgi:thiol:disulfide interchange protein DsbD